MPIEEHTVLNIAPSRSEEKGKQMKVFLNISNHPSSKWSKSQIDAAHADKIIDVPFPNIDPKLDWEEIALIATRTVEGAMGSILKGDTIIGAMIGGELVCTIMMLEELTDRRVPCYSATTERKVTETIIPDGTIKKEAIFEFVSFRRIPS